MDGFPLLVLTVAIVGAFCYFVKPSALFVIRIRQGVPTATNGTVTAAFLAGVEEQCKEMGIVSGEVRGLPRGDRISLHFSRGLSAPFRQRMRNVWAMDGWALPKRCGKGGCG